MVANIDYKKRRNLDELHLELKREHELFVEFLHSGRIHELPFISERINRLLQALNGVLEDIVYSDRKEHLN